jgi:hypothetical protein
LHFLARRAAFQVSGYTIPVAGFDGHHVVSTPPRERFRALDQDQRVRAYQGLSHALPAEAR